MAWRMGCPADAAAQTAQGRVSGEGDVLATLTLGGGALLRASNMCAGWIPQRLSLLY